MIYVNKIQISPTIFPDGTSQVWHLPEFLFKAGKCEVEWKFESEAEFMHLAQLKALLDRYFSVITLTLPYLPYGRQDKRVGNDSTFALLVFAKLLNALKFNAVFCVDPHSVVVSEINKVHPVYPVDAIRRAMREIEPTMICFPDHGALVKYVDLQDVVFNDLPFIYGDKVRDQQTGKITDYMLCGDPTGQSILVVDDICDGGATFTALAVELKKYKAKEINLFVSHGIFSRGTQVLRDAGISRIFTKEGEVK